MLRCLGAALSVIALLLGLIAAPYTHVHPSAPGQDPHSRPTALMHTHVTPHGEHDDSHHPPVEGSHEAEQTMWSVAGFVFQPAPAASVPSPALAVSAAHAVSPGTWVRGVSVTQPGAHAPPFIGGSNLRAPPIAPAALS